MPISLKFTDQKNIKVSKAKQSEFIFTFNNISKDKLSSKLKLLWQITKDSKVFQGFSTGRGMPPGETVKVQRH